VNSGLETRSFLDMARTDIVVDLRTYKAQLTAELKRVEAALTVLMADGETPGQGMPPTAGTGTYDLLRAFIVQQPQFDAHGALRYLTDHGWKADQREHALNAIRSALAHLTAWGEIERVRRGVYRIRVSPPTADLAEAIG
jgi:hypothetical protein